MENEMINKLKLSKYEVTLIVDNSKVKFTFTNNYENDLLKVLINNDNNILNLKVFPKKEIELYSIDAFFDYNFSNEKILLNGYQSWSHSQEVDVGFKDKSLKLFNKNKVREQAIDMFSDYTFENIDHDTLHSYSYSYLRKNEKYFFIGSLNEKDGFTVIYFDFKHKQLHIQKDCMNTIISNEYSGLSLILEEGEENKVFDNYFEKLNISKVPFVQERGYTSWYNYYQNINEKVILKDLESLKLLHKKPTIFQIDDGFETKVGDWLSVDKNKFPNSLNNIVNLIKKDGYKAGLWISPFICEKDSSLFKEHYDYLIKDENNQAIKCGCPWSGCYGLDIDNVEVQNYIKKVFKTYIDMGFDLFKLDFLYGCCFKPLHGKNRGQLMYQGMNFLRDILKDKLILACGVPLSSAFGLVDYCRIGPDVTLDYDDKFIQRFSHRERPSTKHAMLNSIYRRQLNTRAFINDTDVLILRNTNTKLSKLQKETLAKVNCLCGGVIFSSDDSKEYDENILSLYDEVTELNYHNIVSVDMKHKHTIVRYKDKNNEIQTLIIK